VKLKGGEVTTPRKSGRREAEETFRQAKEVASGSRVLENRVAEEKKKKKRIAVDGRKKKGGYGNDRPGEKGLPKLRAEEESAV